MHIPRHQGEIEGGFYERINDGGGLYNEDGDPTLTGCTFRANVATFDGGGMYNHSQSQMANPSLTNCRFFGNQAGRDGGGLYNFRGDPTSAMSVFSGNRAWGHGGGIYTDSGNPTFTNCIFSVNRADLSGGGLYIYEGLATLVNCTLTAHGRGGGPGGEGGTIHTDSGDSTVLSNCILWVRDYYSWPPWAGPAEPVFDETEESTITYSIVQGGWPGVGNIDEDPRFAMDFVPRDYPYREDETHELSFCSSAIDAGDPSFTAEPDATDFQQNARTVNGRVDIGAYEYQEHGLVVEAEGSRYLGVTLPWPATPQDPVAFLVEGLSDSVSCVSGYVQTDGLLGLSPVFQYPNQWCNVHARGAEIIPEATYALEAWVDSWETPELLGGADATLWVWADVDNNGLLNMTDVQWAVVAFENPFWIVPLESADIASGYCAPNQVLNMTDVQWVILAFEGRAFSPFCPLPCGEGFHGGGGMQGAGVEGGEMQAGGTLATFSLVPAAELINPGDLVDVDVFIDYVADLGAYQVVLDVTGGDAATLDLEDLTIDTNREDYVFGSDPITPGLDMNGGRLGAVRHNGGIEVTGPSYVGTFSYRASADASGVFTVSVRENGDSFLNDSGGVAVPSSAGDPASIGVDIECFLLEHCDDSTDCTADACVSYACQNDPEPSGTPCDDGLFCTAIDECDGNGTCVGRGNPCPRPQICNELMDVCIGGPGQ